MNLTKQVKAAAIAAITTMVLVVSLSSFIKHDPPGSGTKKTNEPKIKQDHLVQAKNSLVFQTYYWDGSSWQNEPQTDCVGNGAICSVGFSPNGTNRSVPDICNDAVAAYIATGNLSNPSINTGTVTVQRKSPSDGTTILCTVTEKAN